MTKEAISVAVKNAIERNEDLELAKVSLLNAGYISSEIDEASREISSSPIEISHKNEVVANDFSVPSPEENVKIKKGVPFWVILLGMIFIVLIASGVAYFLTIGKH